jgi:hypothetical protein
LIIVMKSLETFTMYSYLSAIRASLVRPPPTVNTIP